MFHRLLKGGSRPGTFRTRAATHMEIEIKLRVRDITALGLCLKRLRAREISPRTYESNALYDTPAKDLTRRGKLLRIRIETPGVKGGRIPTSRDTPALLTYKGPARRSRASKKPAEKSMRSKRFKIREEIEVTFTGTEQLNGILLALGLRPTFRYEKFRTTYALPGIRNLKVEFDETPVGLFIELEGSAAAIDRAARLLGYSPRDYITQTYGALYLEDCRRRGARPAHMLFHATRKSR